MNVGIMLCAMALLVDPQGAPSEAPAAASRQGKSEGGRAAAADAQKASLTKTAPVGQAKADLELLQIEKNIVDLTNQRRVKAGLPALQVDASLMKSARRHCTWMTLHRSLTHTNGPVAENIAMGQSNSGEAVRDWMNSPGHRANILSRGYRRIGAAAYRTPGGTIYWCQQFLR